MDWIEQLFGFSPDGGNGTTEMQIATGVALLALFLASLALRRPGAREALKRLLPRHVRS